jgi:hypothetical protein
MTRRAGLEAVRATTALLLALALWPPAAGAADGSQPVTKLERIATVSAQEPLRLPFKLPPGARQGRGGWYMVRLNVSVKAEPTTRSGVATLSADVDGLVSNLVELRVGPGEECPRKMAWATVDLFDGARDRAACGDRVGFVSRNFAQNKAIRPGSRLLRVSLEDPHDMLEAVELRPGSGVYRTDAGPAKLRINVTGGGEGFTSGEWLKVEMSIENVGQRPSRTVGLQVEADPDLEFKRRKVRVSPLIEPGRSAEARVWVRPRGAEPVRFGLVAEGRTGRAATEVVVEPATADSSDWSVGRVSFLVALGGVAFLCCGAFMKKRRPAPA